MNIKAVESPYLTLRIENSILIGVYKENAKIDLKAAKEMIAHRLAFVNDKKYPALADVRNLKSITKEARDYFAKGDGVKGMTALAVLVSNFMTAMIANLFVNFSRPEVPTRVFSDQTEAMRWLNKFVKKEEPETVTKSVLS